MFCCCTHNIYVKEKNYVNIRRKFMKNTNKRISAPLRNDFYLVIFSETGWLEILLERAQKVWAEPFLNFVEFRKNSGQNQVVQQVSYKYNVRPELLRSKVNVLELLRHRFVFASLECCLLEFHVLNHGARCFESMRSLSKV